MNAVATVQAQETPARSVAERIINGSGKLLGAAGVEPMPLDAGRLMAKAAARAGHDDFGDGDFVEGLERLVDALRKEARLTLIGRVVARDSVLSSLAVRLRMVRWRNAHPELEREEIRRPLFISGLPRTGTTILHGLLDIDPANRSPASWEVASPTPPATPERWDDDPRIAAEERRLGKLRKLRPGLQAMHSMGARMPQECVSIFASDFRSEQFPTMFDVPSYTEWIDAASFAKTYQWHKRFLQHLQSGGVVGERWLLKSPCHLHLLDDLLATYPDANVIYTHRDPIEVCVSVASLLSTLRGISSDDIDFGYIGRQQLDWWEKLLSAGMASRERHANRSGQFLDVNMAEIVADPLAVAERVYARFGFGLTGDVKAGMERYMRDNPRDKHGAHTCTAEQFGIDRARESRRFEAYRERFGV